MELTARRVVTGHDAEGRAVIVSDGPPENTIRANGFAVATWLWLDGPPTTVDGGGEVPDGPRQLEPPPGGGSVMLIRFPGTSEGGGDWIRVEGDDPDQPGMHATDTLDFMTVVEGRIVLGLDDGEHELGAGDVVIQRGNRHRWRVASEGPCTYIVCMLRPDADAPPPAEPQMTATSIEGHGPRRLVAATDADGRSYALTDGTPPAALDAGDTRLVELWQTGGALGAPDQGGDPEGGWELEPRGAGTCFRTVRLPAGNDPGEAGWHTTATIDVDVVLSGRLELALPDTEPVVIGPGEAVVQRGTHHKWRPVGDEPVEWVALMLAVGKLTRMLLTEDHDRARLITFNRPDRANAFNEALYHASADALRAAAADDGVGVVVFTGAGKAFCAGTDLLEMAETVDGTAGSRNGFPAFVDVLQEFPKPLLAAVNGSAVGLGFTMLAHCDLVFVSDRARLLAPFTTMGVAPEAASSYLLPRRMGRQQASLSLFTSDWISAEQAVATGLAVKQCSPETLVEETLELATSIASKSLPSLMATKRLLLDAEREGIVRARELENAAFAELLALPNARDGVVGQLEK